MKNFMEKIRKVFKKAVDFLKEASKNKKVFIPCCIAVSCVVLSVVVTLCVFLTRGDDAKQTELNETQGQSYSESETDSEKESKKESESKTASDNKGETESESKSESKKPNESGSSPVSGDNEEYTEGFTDDTQTSTNSTGPKGSVTTPDSGNKNPVRDNPKPANPTVTEPTNPTETKPKNPTVTKPTDPPATESTKPTEPQDNLKTRLSVTICAPVATGVSIVGGICSGDAQAIHVSGSGIQDIDIYPDYNNDGGYFIGQVKSSASCNISVCEMSGGTRISQVETKSLTHKKMTNLMQSDEYMPVFGKNSRMHFYSAIVTYSRSGLISDSIKKNAKNKITNNVNTVKEANPNAELIYLVVPSSAHVYPETVPDEYPRASGETIFDAFKSVAEQSGATVIYPLDLFTQHKNDGAGYKIYHNTDSHWTTYGAYWGMYSLMSHIAGKYPAAAPRSFDDMGFYTTQLFGGDSLFSFGDNGGFENISLLTAKGKTIKTKISENTTLYNRKMPTNTLYDVYRGNASTYVSGDNGAEKIEYNPSPAGLPSALVIRDSFGCTVYDMFNDRFSTVYWQKSHNYRFPANAVNQNSPDYVIYIVSERNLLKVMLENGNANICR